MWFYCEKEYIFVEIYTLFSYNRMDFGKKDSEV